MNSMDESLNVSTAVSAKGTVLTLDNILEAVKNIKPIKKQYFECSKKHLKMLKKQLVDNTTKSEFIGAIGSLYGIEIRVRPYLKKVRLYTEK